MAGRAMAGRRAVIIVARRIQPIVEEDRMTTAGWITMVLIMTFVWGGFALALRAAVRSESRKGK